MLWQDPERCHLSGKPILREQRQSVVELANPSGSGGVWGGQAAKALPSAGRAGSQSFTFSWQVGQAESRVYSVLRTMLPSMFGHY